MKIQCSISGIEFSVEHYPLSLYNSGYFHPIFLVPQKRLLLESVKYFNEELNSTDSYLLFLSLLNSTQLVEWKTPAVRTAFTDSIIANNLEALTKTIAKINLITHPSFILSKISITQDTKTLDNVKYWIENWEEQIADFQDGYKTFNDSRALLTRELALERLIKDKNRNVDSYARNLSEWAAKAGNFPENISDFWKEIIRKCARAESIFSIRKVDLDELIEHCELNIIHGSIYSHALMELLRKGKERQFSFLGLDEVSTGETQFKILDSENVEDANKLALIAAAPSEMPIESNYPNRLAYIRAKFKYELAVAYSDKSVSTKQTEESKEIKENL